jgi:hypothetical protein
MALPDQALIAPRETIGKRERRNESRRSFGNDCSTVMISFGFGTG